MNTPAPSASQKWKTLWARAHAKVFEIAVNRDCQQILRESMMHHYREVADRIVLNCLLDQLEGKPVSVVEVQRKFDQLHRLVLEVLT